MEKIIYSIKKLDINKFVDEIKNNINLERLFIKDNTSLSLENRAKTLDILRAFKFCYPKKKVIIKTKNSFQNLLLEKDEDITSILIYLDYLIDKSCNNCFIDIAQSIKVGDIIISNILD